jgi:hypothetical protein
MVKNTLLRTATRTNRYSEGTASAITSEQVPPVKLKKLRVVLERELLDLRVLIQVRGRFDHVPGSGTVDGVISSGFGSAAARCSRSGSFAGSRSADAAP